MDGVLLMTKFLVSGSQFSAKSLIARGSLRSENQETRAENGELRTGNCRRLLLRLPIAFHVFGLAYVVRSAHAAQHVVGEEKLAVRRHHHDLQFVGETLGDNFVNQ